MPKAPRSKNASSLKDFDKQKTKLGKGKKPAPSNATSTSFKARSIALTQQSITKGPSSAPTSNRNLTVEDLIGQTRHYSASVRRDALAGLKEIYSAHPGHATHQLSLVIPNIARLIADEEAGVREGLIRFLSFYIPLVPKSMLQSYGSTFVLHATSAMSHIYSDIRLDAVRVINMLYPVLGQFICSGWQQAVHLSEAEGGQSSSEEETKTHGERVLRCLLALLGLSSSLESRATKTSSTTFVLSNDLPSSARLTILQTLCLFFEYSQSSQELDGRAADCPTWFFESTISSPSELAAFRSLFEVKGHGESADKEKQIGYEIKPCWTSEDTSEALTAIQDHDYAKVKQGEDVLISKEQQLFCILSPLLISVFLDAAPIAFGHLEGDQDGTSTSSRLVVAVSALTLHLWRGGAAGDKAAKDCLARLLTRMAVYFPFGKEWKESEAMHWTELNLAYCELIGLYNTTSSEIKKGKEDKLAKELDTVSGYINHLLRHAGRRDRIGPPALQDGSLVNLLPTIWLLLCRCKPQEGHTTLESVVYYWSSLQTRNPAKRIGAQFLGRLCLLSSSRSFLGDDFVVQPTSLYRASLVRWLLTLLPRYLWELHTRDVVATGMVLQLYRNTCLASKTLDLCEKELHQLSAALAPFFQIIHPSKGPMPGPYAHLPHSLQQVAKGVLQALPCVDVKLERAAQAVGAY